MSYLTCNYYNQQTCRSCSLLSMAQEEFALHKSDSFLRQLSDGGWLELDPLELFSPKKLFNSRCRAKLSVAGTVTKPVVGLLNQDFQGVDLCSCPLHFEEITLLLGAIPAVVRKFKLEPYQVKERKGELKGVIIRAAADRKSLSLRFVMRSAALQKSIGEAAKDLMSQFPKLKQVSMNLQSVPHQIVEGPEEILIAGDKVLWERLGLYQLAFQSQSFVQATPETALELYKYAAGLVEDGTSGMLDLYCGGGGFSIFAGGKAKWVKGIELSSASIECARLSAKKNGLSDYDYQAADVDCFLSSYSGPVPELILVNPPRRGLSEVVQKFILNSGAKQLIYSSCLVESLVRDLKILNQRYDIELIKPFDMFPLTEHLEILACLRIH